MARSARGRTRNLSLGPLVQHKPPSPLPGRNHTATSRKPTHSNTKENGLNIPTQNPGLDKFPPHTHPQPPTLRPQQAQPRPNTTANHAPTHNRQPTRTGDFTTIDTPPRRVAGVSQPYGRNSPHTPTHNRQPRPRPCRFRATNLRLPLRTPRGGLPCAARAPGRPGDIGSLSGTRRLGAPLHWCHA